MPMSRVGMRPVTTNDSRSMCSGGCGEVTVRHYLDERGRRVALCGWCAISSNNDGKRKRGSNGQEDA